MTDMNSVINPENQENIEKILMMQEAMLEMDGHMKGDSLPLKHHFAPGVYLREIFIPAGMVVIGKIHRHEHHVIFVSGEVTFVSESGNHKIKAPHTMVSPIGAKRAVFAHVDSIIMTVHQTNETDIEKIEKEVIVGSFEQLQIEIDEQSELLEGKSCLG